LALSRHALSNKFEHARRDVQASTVDANYYDIKLKAALDSLPKNFLETRKWTEFGNTPIQLEQHPVGKDRIFCFIAHSNEQIASLLEKRPNTRIIKLINYRDFNKFCFGLKSPGNLKRHMASYAPWDKHSVPGHFDFDIDTVYRVDDFLTEVKRMYDFLELDDFQPKLVQQFHRAYLDCHGLT
jgi:hypothetical protein